MQLRLSVLNDIDVAFLRTARTAGNYMQTFPFFRTNFDINSV